MSAPDGRRMIAVPICADDGGRGMGAGHHCYCLMKPGHMTAAPWAGHGCTCGAIWGREPEAAPDSDTATGAE